MSEEDTSTRIKVTDKRRFTSDGELRAVEDEQPPSSSGVAEPSSKAPAASGPGDDAPTGERHESDSLGSAAPLRRPEFLDLVSMLAEPIPIFLGDVELPGGESAENLDLARFHIDLLEVLETKTRSNLSSDEHALLDDLLYKLRMRYVQKRG